MAVFQFAIDLYAMKYGHPPQVLSDLAPGPGHLPGDACFLPPRGQILSPWNTPYHLRRAAIRKWFVPLDLRKIPSRVIRRIDRMD